MLLALLLAASVSQPVQASGTEWLVQVKPGVRRNFHDGSARGCPALTAKCRRAAYVVPGDQLIAASRLGAFTNVTFVSRAGKVSSGWIETAGLTRIAAPPPTARAWVGRWRAWENDIEVKPIGAGRYRIEGTALWGTEDPWRVENGGVHVGEFSAAVSLSGDRLAFATTWSRDDPVDHPALAYGAANESACRIRLRLLGTYLIAQDNHQCGGANVTFTGIYRRTS